MKEKHEDHEETTVTKGQSPTAVDKGHSQSMHEVVRPTARGVQAKSEEISDWKRRRKELIGWK